MCPKVESLLRATAGLFSQSSKRLEAWEKILEEHGEEESRIKNLHEIRWLSRGASTKSVVVHIDSLMVFIQGLSSDARVEINHRDGDDKYATTKIGALAENWRDFFLLACLHFCADIFGQLSDLSTVFQKEQLDITEATDKINKLKLGIDVYYLGDELAFGEHTRRFLQRITGFSADVRNAEKKGPSQNVKTVKVT